MNWLDDENETERNIELADLRYKLECAIEALEYLQDIVTDDDALEVVQDTLLVVRAD